VPRLINLLCDAGLAIGYRTQQIVIQVDAVEEAAAELRMDQTPTSAPSPGESPSTREGSESSATTALQETVAVSARQTAILSLAVPQKKVEVPCKWKRTG